MEFLVEGQRSPPAILPGLGQDKGDVLLHRGPVGRLTGGTAQQPLLQLVSIRTSAFMATRPF